MSQFLYPLFIHFLDNFRHITKIIDQWFRFLYNTCDEGEEMKSKILENKKQKENKLLKSAFDLFTTRDIDTVTISEIARHAGVAKGTFYLYFKDKDQIRNILISRESRRIFLNAQKALEENDIRGFEDAIIFMINHILMELKKNRSILAFIEKNLSWGIFSDYVQNAFADDELHIKNDFIQLTKKNHYQFKDPEVVMYIIIDMVGSTCYSSIINNKPLPIDQYKPYLFDAVRAILRTGKTNEE